MKKLFFLVALALFSYSASAQESKGYQFTTVKELPVTSIKNQGNSGTCWSFSAVAFLESELIRMGKGEHDLSEMYIVRRNYADKAEKYIRQQGYLNFAQGGSFADVIETINEYGVVPEDSYKGLNYGETSHKHGEIEAVVGGFTKGVLPQGSKRTLSPVWKKALNGILDTYFGEVPQSFDVNGKTYTAQEYAKSLGLDSDNYISLTSYTHHPFYKPFAIEIPDNWRWALSYNLPIDEFMSVMTQAIEKGYTIAWASDVSEVGFTRTGLAVFPDENAPENVGSDQAHWLGLSATARNNAIKEKIEEGPMKEKVLTQEERQLGFDNFETTDDHGMQIYGIAKDQNGNKYFMVKNSWGVYGPYKGHWYASEAFVRAKTMSIMIHKDALPKDLAKKLGIK